VYTYYYIALNLRSYTDYYQYNLCAF
jgi:hypothetical protein